jgi:hypothetical protein
VANLNGVRSTLISNHLGAEANGGFLMVEYHKSSAPISLCPQMIDQINVDLTPFKFLRQQKSPHQRAFYMEST